MMLTAIELDAIRSAFPEAVNHLVIQPDAPPNPACIVCLICGAVSYNPNDVKNKYCGFCRQFFEFLPGWKEQK